MQLEKLFTSDISLNTTQFKLWGLYNLKPLTMIKQRKRKKSEKKYSVLLWNLHRKNDCTESLVCYPHLSTATILMSGKTEEEQACKAK